MANTVIVGGDPAGISVALYTLHTRIATTTIGKDDGASEKVEKIENYYGFPEPITGTELVQTGSWQAKRLDAQMVEDEVVGIPYGEHLTIRATHGEYPADSLIPTTGSTCSAPRIRGLQELEDHGVGCYAVRDSFFYRDKEIMVLGDDDYAIHETLGLLRASRSVTVLTNDKRMLAFMPGGVGLYTKEVQSLGGDQALSGVYLEDGISPVTEGAFVVVSVAGSTDLTHKPGTEVENNKIVVDENMAASTPGLYMAGDCTGNLFQIPKAVYKGAKVGTEAAKPLHSMTRTAGAQ